MKFNKDDFNELMTALNNYANKCKKFEHFEKEAKIIRLKMKIQKSYFQQIQDYNKKQNEGEKSNEK